MNTVMVEQTPVARQGVWDSRWEVPRVGDFLGSEWEYLKGFPEIDVNMLLKAVTSPSQLLAHAFIAPFILK